MLKTDGFEVMIDLETLDTGHRAVILSAAAVLFDDSGPVGVPWYSLLEVEPQISVGRTVSMATLRWWHDQDREVRAEAFREKGRNGVMNAILELSSFVSRGNAKTVWANGPSFDCVLWESLCRDFGMDKSIPWRYNEVRDTRTLREESGVPRDFVPRRTSEYMVSLPAGMHRDHHPVYDCAFQIGVVLEARRRMRFGSAALNAGSAACLDAELSV